MRRRIFVGALLGVTLGWMALLLLGSAWRNPSRPDVGPELGSTPEAYLAHFVAFCVLGILVSCNIFLVKGRHHILLPLVVAFLAGLIWGTATEAYQLNVPTRHASLLDVLTNALGAVTGGTLVLGIRRLPRLST